MATIPKVATVGKDRHGRWLPSYMTDGEIRRELATGTSRRAQLEAEMRERAEARDKTCSHEPEAPSDRTCIHG